MAAHPAHATGFPNNLATAKSELASLIDMMPAGFELLSAGTIARQAVELVSNAANVRRFDSVLTSAQSHLREACIPILITEPRVKPPLSSTNELSRSQRRWLGQLALELYFTQLFRSDVTLFDLWPSRLGVDEAGDAVWSPRPLYLRWDRRFRRGLQDIYAGFFLESKKQFDTGVFELGIGNAASILVEHFGGDNQRSVRFGPERLRETLRAMSTRRSDDDKKLHPNFVAFGLYLTALHELLGSLDVRFDVRAAFMRSYPGNRQR